MQRALSELSKKVYDVAIIGGGIYGACVAWDAALRGLSVALVEQGDLGSATSANSQKIIHGGLRYLQYADFKRMRESIRERSILMRIAPHLVFPMPVLIPTYGKLLEGKTVMGIALKLHDLIGFDRNRDLDAHKRIPPGRIISKSECLQYCPYLEQEELTGGALFFDGQVYNTERLTLSFLISAARWGAVIANYAQATGFLRDGGRVTGMFVKDLLSPNSAEVRAKVFINCSGPWTDRVVELTGIIRRHRKKRWLKAVVLVTRQLLPDVAIGVRGKFRYQDSEAIFDKRYRYFFITPCRNRSLIGTFEVPYDGDPGDFTVTEEDIRSFIEGFNSASPTARIDRDDVYSVYGGLVPAADPNGTPDIQATKHYELHDHAVEDGVEGIVSVIGVKYTTARHVAETAVNLIERKLRRRPVVSQTAVVPVHGGGINCFEEFLDRELQRRPPGLSEETIRHLVHTYGSEYRKILEYCEEDSRWAQPVITNSPVIKAEILHGIREEMACKLDDILYRRTELATAGYPDDSCVNSCAEIMAHELGWEVSLKRTGEAMSV